MPNFIVPENFLEDRLSRLEKIITRQEKEALLVDDEEPIEDIVKILTDIVPINHFEAEAFLIKIREISGGDIIEYIQTCPHCEVMNDIQITTSELIDLKVPSKFKDFTVPIGLFTELDSIINNKDMDEMTIGEYTALERFVRDRNDKILKRYIDRVCRKCTGTFTIQVEPRDIFSKSTLSSIYKDYVNISMFTNNGSLDIDSLYPFEREIYNNLIQEKMQTED